MDSVCFHLIKKLIERVGYLNIIIKEEKNKKYNINKGVAASFNVLIFRTLKRIFMISPIITHPQ